LGNQAGAARVLLSGMGLAAGAAAGSVVALGVAATKGYLELRALETAILATGGASGLTAGQVANMADQVGEATGRYGDAEKAAALLVKSGAASAGTLEDMVTAAVNLSRLTGESIEDTTRKVARLAKEPTEGVRDLDRQLSFLPATTCGQIRALEGRGRRQEAVRLALGQAADMSRTRVAQMVEQAGMLGPAWRSVGETVGKVWRGMKSVLRNDIDQQIKTLESDIEFFRQMQTGWGFRGDRERGQKGEAVARAKLAELLAQKARGEAAAEEEQEQRTAAEEAKAAMERVDALVASLDKEAAKRREINEVLALYNKLDRDGQRTGNYDSRLFDGSQEKLLAAIEEKYKPRSTPKGPRGDDPDKAAAREVA